MTVQGVSINFDKLNEHTNDLLPITLDQLRTFLAVCQELSPRRGGQLLRREQTSVEKQLKTLEDRFEKLAHGKLIVRAAQRGGDIQLTEAGDQVRQFAEFVLKGLADLSMDIRSLQQDRPIRIALTTFMISLLGEIQPAVMEAFKKVGIRLNRELVHVRSNQIQTVLENKEVDFSLGGFVARAGEESPIDEALEFIEWKREELGLLSSYNLEVDTEAVSSTDLIERRIPLIVPRQGLIHDLLDIWFGGQDLDNKLNVVEWCDDVHFAMDLLHLKVYEASMISTSYISRWIKERPNSGHLRFYKIKDSGCQLRVGLFRRKDIGKVYSKTHPLTVFWQVFKKLASERSKKGESGSTR
jgi:DNA-binding transcriptional LysR family regulator